MEIGKVDDEKVRVADLIGIKRVFLFSLYFYRSSLPTLNVDHLDQYRIRRCKVLGADEVEIRKAD